MLLLLRTFDALPVDGAVEVVAAADLYRPQLENDLRHPNTGLYPGIAATLATMAQLYERGGRSADFASVPETPGPQERPEVEPRRYGDTR